MITTSNAVMSFILLRRIIRHVCIGVTGVALLLLSGCSTLRLVYNQSDDLLYWWMDGYVDFQEEQKPFVRSALTDLQKWHRQQQLPDYITTLQELRALAPQDITPAQACTIADKAKNSFIALLRQLEPSGAQLAAQLTPEQLKTIRKRYDKTNKDWREDWLEGSEEKLRRHRFKQARNRLEDMYGKLDNPQRDALRQWLNNSKFDPRISYAERERRQSDVLQTVQLLSQADANSANAQALVRALVDRLFQSPNERFQTYSQALLQDNCEGFARLHNSTTSEQRQRLVENLRNYEADLRSVLSPKR
jgi:hypothetical protein